MNKLNFKLETLLFILLFYGIATAQEYYYQDYIKSSNHQSRREYDAFDENGNPLNRTKEVVFIFIDYPDGRFIHNGIRK
ncbi:MAG: hypothetical protein MUE56_04895 [Ignavibacteria bacterium]|jgi:hypothetical protein|nr:hypothetical protein [Ignavibacteria bacterium]